MSLKINNPHLLKLITTFFGFLGLPTLLLKSSNQKSSFLILKLSSLITWLWTAVFNITILYQFAFKDPFLIKKNGGTVNGKPLSLLLYHFSGAILHFVTHAFLLFYYLFYGNELAEELNKLLLLSFSDEIVLLTTEKAGQNQKKNAFWCFLFFQLFAGVTFVLCYYDVLSTYVQKCFDFKEQMLGFLTMYTDYMYFLLPLLTAHLLEYTLHQMIRSTLNEFFVQNQNCHFGSEERMNPPLSVIKNLGARHCRLLKLNSTPLFVVVASNTIDALVVLALAETYINYSYLFHVTTIFAYLFVGVYYSEKTISLLSGAGQRLHICKIEQEEALSQFKVLFSRPKAFKSIQNRHLFYIESLAVYKSYFGLKVFNLFSLSYLWMLQLMLFILNYTVLIRQTKT